MRGLLQLLDGLDSLTRGGLQLAQPFADADLGLPVALPLVFELDAQRQVGVASGLRRDCGRGRAGGCRLLHTFALGNARTAQFDSYSGIYPMREASATFSESRNSGA